MRALIVGCVVATLVAVLAGCGGSSRNSAAEVTTQRDANLYEIDQIEQSWHKATSTHDLNLMMSLWAPGAVFNIGTETLTGKAQIRHWFATKNGAFQHHWESDTPSYKIKITVNGDKATLYFECHYIDPKTAKVEPPVGVDHDLQKINGRWLIVDSAGATPVLSP
ncbi:MAG TPA: nuclear transport factor 2 family protein [Gaiellaceae bacterium]|jgi:ketosteroid isomerase-like protein